MTISEGSIFNIGFSDGRLLTGESAFAFPTYLFKPSEQEIKLAFAI